MIRPTSNKRLIIGLSVLMTLMGCTETTDSLEFNPQLALLPAVGVSGSMAPFLSRGHDGSIAMSWLDVSDDGSSLQFALLEEASWGASGTVASGDNWYINWADFPSVIPLAEDLWSAHWSVRQESGAYAHDVNLAFSLDQGKTWSEPALGHTDGSDTEHGFASFYPSDLGIGFVYLDGRKQANEYTEDPNETGMTLRAAVLTLEGELVQEQLVDNLICDCCQTDVAVTDEGPIAVYRNRTVKEIRDIYVTRRVNDEWTTGVPVSDDNWEIYGCPVNGPEIAAQGANVAVAWFTGANATSTVKFVRSADSGKTFAAPVEIASGEVLGHVGLTLDTRGNAWVIWHATAGEGQVELRLRRVFGNNELGPVHTIVEKGGVASFSVPQIMSDDHQLVVAWTAGEYGSTRILSGKIALPIEE